MSFVILKRPPNQKLVRSDERRRAKATKWVAAQSQCLVEGKDCPSWGGAG